MIPGSPRNGGPPPARQGKMDDVGHVPTAPCAHVLLGACLMLRPCRTLHQTNCRSHFFLDLLF